jgi:hypothetical protein
MPIRVKVHASVARNVIADGVDDILAELAAQFPRLRSMTNLLIRVDRLDPCFIGRRALQSHAIRLSPRWRTEWPV